MNIKKKFFCPSCCKLLKMPKHMAIKRGKLEQSKACDNLYFCHSCSKYWEIVDGKLIQKYFED